MDAISLQLLLLLLLLVVVVMVVAVSRSRRWNDDRLFSTAVDDASITGSAS